MSLYPETRVNTYRANEQTNPDIAVLVDGSYVIVWQSYAQDGSGWGVYFQRFAANGTPIGPELRANAATGSNQTDAHVAATSDGGFVVTWSDDGGLDGSGNGVFGQQFNAAGAAQGGNFGVNTTTDSTQYQSNVAGYTGGYATVWISYGNAGGDGYDVYLQRWNNDGTKAGGETLVSKTPGSAAPQAGTQQAPDVAAAANGNLVVVWEDQNGNDGSSYGVYGRRYNAATGIFSDAFLINTTTTGAQYEAKVAMFADGSFVVVWRSDGQDGSGAGLYGQRFDSAGAKAGGEFLVNESTTGNQFQASVTALSTGGFVVGWYSDYYDTSNTGTTQDVYVREFSATGVAVAGQVKLVSSTNGAESQPVIADLGGGRYVVSYVDATADGQGNDIVQQLFGPAGSLALQAAPTLGNFTGSVTFGENLVNATPQVIQVVVGLTDLDSPNFDGGRLDLFYVQGGDATDQLGVRNVGNGANQIGVVGNTIRFEGQVIGTLSGGANGSNLVITLNANATVDAVEELIQNLTYGSTSSDPAATRTVGIRVSDGDGGATASSTMTINVTPQLDGAPVVYGETTVNSWVAGDQQASQVAVLADGSYVVVWQSNGQDGDYWGVYGQRHTASGVPIGPEFRVNTITGGEQSYAHVAGLTGANGGGFVVTWQDNSGSDGSGWGIYGQRYDASGTAVGSQFRVNTATDNSQYHDSVASYNGGFAVVWASNASNGFDIFLKRFDNTGAVVTGETRVSANPGDPGNLQPGDQYLPDVAAFANGNLVIVWQDNSGNDGSVYGVYGRTYNAAAGTFSNAFLVNTTTAGYQYEPSVATLADGGFVVVWRSDNQDGSSAGVYGQRYDAAGAKAGGEFLVNETTNGGQYQAAVTGLSSGGFVVSFYNDNYDITGSGTTSDVYIREYNAAGQPIDGQRKLISPSDSTEQSPAIADLGGGNFVVAYSDYATGGSGGNNTYEIAQQIFGSAAALVRQQNPQLAGFVGSVTFGENLVNASPQLISTPVAVTDLDSADFAGGRLDLFYVQGGDATDQLGVRNTGTGANQIGVAGNTVSYGGVAIGTISGGANGSNLQITLTAAATAHAVEALIDSLTYASTSSDPAAQRTVGIRVSDGDGGASNSGTVTINVTPQLDGAPVAYGESAVNTYSANTQEDPEITVLANGSYVIVWTSTAEDGDGRGVYGQRFAANGLALGSEFKVNATTAGNQEYPHAAALSDGGFVVVWQDDANDGSGYGVYAQRYNAAGVAQGASLLVNNTTLGGQYHGTVAGYSGGFTVVWSSDGNVPGSDGNDIYLRRYDNAGNALTAETRVSSAPGSPATPQQGGQYLPDVAAFANGNLVIVWQDQNGNDGSSYGVYGRTYDAAAGTFSNTFLVNTFTGNAQYEPSVATLSDGGFVVVWRSDGQDGSSTGVYAQRYSAAGTAVGGEFLVNEQVNGGQYQPAVTGLSTGGFVVTWYNDNYDVTNSGSTSDVYIREYNAAGVAIDGERKLATPSTSTQYLPAIADLGNGSFVVAYTDYDNTAGGTNSYDIKQQLFGSVAARPSANPLLGDVRAQLVLSNVAATPLYAGTAQLIDADVSVVDSDSADFSGGQLTVNVLSGLATTDVLAIRNQGTGAGQIGVAGATVSYGGVAIGTFTGGGAGSGTLTVTFNASASAAAVRALVENLLYQNTAPPAGSTDRFIGLRLTDGDGGVSDPGVVQVTIQNGVTPPVLLLDDIKSTVQFTETQAKAGVLIDDAVALNYTGTTGFANGHLTVGYTNGTARVDDQLSIRNEGSGAGQVGVVGNDVRYQGVSIGTISATSNGANGNTLDITWKAAATDAAIEHVIENLVYRNPSAGPLPSRSISIDVTDGAGVSGTARSVTIGVTAQADAGAVVAIGTEQQTNTYEAGDQIDPAVARLSGSNDGGYVIAWTSRGGQDGSGYGVFAQRYDAHGAAVGAEFKANTQTLDDQADVAVSGLSSGGYVLVWRSNYQDGSGAYGVYGQRYAADGSKLGSEFLANTTTTSNQYEPTVLGLSDGSFIVAYRSDYSNASGTYTNDVLAQRYAADGSRLGGEITLNTSGGATQYQPHLAALAGGGFVAVWGDDSGDASGAGIGAQVYTNAGVAVGGPIAVNTTIAGNQQGPDVAALAGGGFVAVWHDDNTSVVYAQLFSASGAKVGGEIAVNTAIDSPANQSNFARVAGLDSGGFIVTWDGNPSATLGGSSQDVMAQQFDAAGNKVDGVRIVNTATYSTQYVPDIAALTGSNVVVAWAGYAEERSQQGSYGVFHQLLGVAGTVTQSTPPLLVDLAAAVTFAENVVNAAPQLIDTGVSLTDGDSANFDGGRLWVSVISGYGNIETAQLSENVPSQDQFGIRNQGSGAGQIGISGSTVSYGGTAIGTIISGGSNGGDLVVQFNPNASASAVEALIENLTYANTSSAPVASRVVSISVSDGDGGTSIPRTVTINVTPDADGAQALYANDKVNTYLPDTQQTPDMAKLSDGGYITVWASAGQDGWDQGVYAQRYDAKGVPVGTEFRVNTYTPYSQQEPTVTGLTGGGYVVAWRSENQDSGSVGVYAQRFANDGTQLGSEFRVNTTTQGSQYQPAITATADGGFVVAWYSDLYASSSQSYDIYFQRYNAAGVAQGVETRANPTGVDATYQSQPSIAGLAAGGFVAVWTDGSADGSSNGVFGQRFNLDGSTNGASFQVNTYTTGDQSDPHVAALNGGGFVVVWQSNGQDGSGAGVFAQRYAANGAASGAEFRVNTTTNGGESAPAVAALSHGGFVVTWSQEGLTIAQQFDASGIRIDGELRADAANNIYAAGSPSVVGLANGGFSVSWVNYSYDGSTYDIYQQLYGKPADFVRQASPQLVDVATSVTFLENTVNATPQLIDPVVGLSDADSVTFNGGVLEVNYLTGYDLQNQLGLQGLAAQDQLGLRNQGNGAGQVGVSGSTVSYGGVVIGTITSDGTNGKKFDVQFNANATVAAVQHVIQDLTYANTFSDPSATRTVSIRVTDGAGGASVARSVTINVTPEFDGARPLYANERVNTYEPGTQATPEMARLSDGSYVTVWSSDGQDGWERGVYGQHYNAQGIPVGTEFQVNTYTPFGEYEPTVTGLAGGGYVVAWRSDNQDGSGSGVYAQRFATDGTPQGSEFLVNSSTGSNQYQPNVTSLAGGGFVVAWYNDAYFSGTQSYDIYFQRYNAAGVAQGAETLVNPSGGNAVPQSQPNLAGLAGGGFVAIWTDGSLDGSSNGVFGQRFNADGSANGGAFQVNTTTDNDQSDPHVAALNGGGFVVVWQSYGEDGSGWGVFGQRYAASGSTVGGAFRVNNNTSGDQTQPAVVALSHGGFAVAWISNNQTLVQQFDAAGVRIDGELRADTLDNNANAGSPALVALANGAFAVSWSDYDYNANSYNVYQQLFGNPADFVRQANPQLVDVAASVTFAENLVNEVPQLIDPGVGLYDADSANFDGGTLEVNYITGYGAQDQLGFQGLDAQDQLGIRNVGNGARQIGVAGSTVSYGGVAIGTITSNGANGGKLTVLFNANATVDAVEHVIESLTYANTVSNPIASRTVSIRVTDGDGGASDPHNVVINVTPQIDGAVAFGSEKVVNATLPGNQEAPSVAHLANGGYVVVWQDENGADGSSYGVYGQRYDGNDNKVGTEFRVNTTTASDQSDAHVVGLAGGGFVAVWTSNGQDGSGYGVYGQRYNADGSTAGGEFRVNTTTSSNQFQSTLTATADGGFVVAWYDDGSAAASGNGDYYDIYFQRYGAGGAPAGSETRASPPITGGNQFAAQSEPSIAWLNDTDGGFVVVWTDNTRDGNDNGIFAQRYSATGAAEGAVLRVNSYVSNNQHNPAVAGLKDGGFVAVWESEGQDLSSTGIYAQRFDANGAKLGAEFRVNTSIGGQQYQPAVTALENGGWAVSWSDSNYNNGSYNDVFVQQYNAAGQQIDGETRVNTYTPYVQYQPSITSMADGGFLVAYAGYIYSSDQNGDGVPDGGNDSFEIRLQRFSNTAPTVSNVSVNGLEEQVITLSNTLFESGFVDPEGQSLQAIKIINLPSHGTLALNGVAITPNQEISLAQLQAGALTYQGVVDFFGADQFRWTGSDGISFATTSVFTNITLTNVNDGPRLGALTNATGSEGSLFSRNLVIGDPDPDSHQVTVNWGDGSANTVFTTSSASPAIQHVFADNGSYNVTVTVDDLQGQANSVESQGFNVAVANVAPTIALAGNNTVEQGQTYTLTLGNPFDPGTDTVDQYTVNWGDGTPAQVYTAATLPANHQLTHVYTGTGPETITVGLRDEDGTYSNAGSKTINVSAPAEVITVDAGADVVVNEGFFFTKTITFVDPTDQGPAGRSYAVTWGDGQTSSGFIAAGTFSFTIGHAYADNGGPFNATVTVDDDDGAIIQQGSDSFLVTVNNVAPVVNLSGAGSVNEGSVYTVTLNPFDPGTDTIGQYVIHWGDGSDQTVLAANLPANRQLTHLYADGDANRVITVDVTDEDGSFLNVGQGGNVFVANVAPTAPVTGANTVNEGSVYLLAVGAVTDPGQDTRTGYSIDWGDGTPTDNFTPAQWAAAAGSFSHTFADGGSAGTPRTIIVRTSDEDGTFVLGTKTLTVANVAPTVVLTGNASTNEGSTYALTIAANDPAGAADPLTYTVDWNDGTAVQTYTALQLAALNGIVTHVYADDQDGPVNSTPRTISVTANDGDGGITTQTKTVNVNNVAPTIALAGAAGTQVGQVYTLTLGAVTDPGQDTVTSYAIDWGDGSAVQTVNAAGNVTHTFSSAANLTITVALTDEDGTFANAGSLAVNVSASTPTVAFDAGPNAAVDEGSSFVRTIAFSDGADNGAPGWSYSIDYGDGTTFTGTTLTQSITLSHVYADGDAARNVSVTITDVAGDSATHGFVVNVANVAPTAPVSGANTVNEGAVYLLSVGTVVDPGQDTRTSYSIDWNDGSTSSFTATQWAAAAGSFTHTFADGTAGGSARTIVVSTTDEDGTFVLGSKVITVANVAPTVTLTGNANTNEGATYTLNVAGFDPAGAADPLTYTVDWNDGSAVQTYTAAQLAAVNGNLTHVYADDQDGPVNSTPRTIVVTANDGDGGITTQTKVVNVDNVAPTAPVSGANTVNEGAVYTLSVGTVVDPGQDTRTSYSIDWNDGSTSSFTAAQWAAAAGSFTHTYADGAAGGSARTIVVSTTDEDGTFVLGSKAITVANVAPTVTLTGNANTNEGAVYTLNLTGFDPAGASDPLTYTVDWNDGSAVQSYTAAQLSAVNGNLTHVYADDQDGPVNSTPRTISVTANDGDGGITTQTKTVNVNNVAPTIALAGAGAVQVGQVYTLNLGSVTDPGQDTVTSYLIDWGDGSAVQTVNAAGNVTHTYASTGNLTISVALVDEDGTFANAGSLGVNVSASTPTLSIEAGPDGAVNEGSAFTRTIAFSDGADNGAAGWGYSIDYGDGTVVTGTTLVQSLDLNHVYADGNAARTVTVTVTDVPGESATDGFVVNVANVAPTAPVSGANTVNEGAAYTLSVGTVVDPGQDTRTSYSIDWNDGSTSSFTAAQWAAAAGSFTHTFADGAAGGSARTIVVSTTDEDGTFVLGTKAITVANVAPTVTLTGNANTNEGAVYTLNLTGFDPAGASDPLTYTVDWNDGSAVQSYTAAQLAGVNGNLTHVYADDQDGPVNSTPHTISVTANDGDGGITTQTKVVSVDNVAPTIALGGSGSATVGVLYTLNLGAVTDPGQDTVTSYLVNWGDGSGVQTYTSAGNVTHTYAGTGSLNIAVSVVDEDGTFAAGSQTVNVGAAPTTTVRIGDAPLRQSGAGGQWAAAWSHPEVTAIDHKANGASERGGWTPVKFDAINPQLLSGGDMYAGDLGVSGQSAATSTVKQELDGSEALRFTLADAATAVTLNLSRFYLNDDGGVLAESGRLRLLDASGHVVAETTFQADSLPSLSDGASGTKLVSLSSATAFTAIELTAGAYNGAAFVYGAYGDGHGGFGAPITTDAGGAHGSDFLVDWVEFTFPAHAPAPVIGVADVLPDPFHH